MRTLIILFTFLVPFTASAATFYSKIAFIDHPKQFGQAVLVFLANGQVTKVFEHQLDLLQKIHQYEKNNDWLNIKTNADREILDIQLALAPSHQRNKLHNGLFQVRNYFPSVLKSEAWAAKYFKESRHNEKASQCYNRAHVWSYEWFKKHKFYSSKIFIFFTQKFIREHDFDWWFHIAPKVHVVVGNTVRERVMDIKYLAGPSSVGEWVKRFIKNGDKCTTVSNYSDYANFPENGSCYLMRTNMYYYWPLDLENEELHGTIKTGWDIEEVKMAYLEAFDITL